MIADLESQITELNSEMDELKEENNANLTVINRLKDSLQETTTRLVYILRTSPFHNLSFSVNLQALAHILVEFCLYYVDLQVCLDSDETGACRSPSPPCLSLRSRMNCGLPAVMVSFRFFNKESPESCHLL